MATKNPPRSRKHSSHEFLQMSGRLSLFQGAGGFQRVDEGLEELRADTQRQHEVSESIFVPLTLVQQRTNSAIKDRVKVEKEKKAGAFLKIQQINKRFN